MKEHRQAHNQSPDQLGFFNPTRAVARRSAPATSHEAAASVNLPLKCERVLHLLGKYGALSDEQMNDKARLEGYHISNTGMAPARCMITPPNGYGVRDSGRRTLNRSGRKAIIWELDPTSKAGVKK